jgi:hypothetical protein
MQTFLPYPSFEETATVLDKQRIGKQRVEAYQVLNIITTPDYTGGWHNHPAVHMWRGYEDALRLYLNAMLVEWEDRGFQNNMVHYDLSQATIVFPWWLGDARLHDSHKSNLLRKDPTYYSQFGWQVPANLPYFWPVPSIKAPPKAKSSQASSLSVSEF